MVVGGMPFTSLGCGFSRAQRSVAGLLFTRARCACPGGGGSLPKWPWGRVLTHLTSRGADGSIGGAENVGVGKGAGWAGEGVGKQKMGKRENKKKMITNKTEPNQRKSRTQKKWVSTKGEMGGRAGAGGRRLAKEGCVQHTGLCLAHSRS